MSRLDAARDALLGLADELAARGDAAGPAWLAGRRERARADFAAQGLPHRKLEEWRYTSLAPLSGLDFTLPDPSAPESGPRDAAVERGDVERLAFPVFACSLHVFVDGRYDRRLSALGSGSDLRVASLASPEAAEHAARHLGALVDAKQHPFAALNTALLEDGALLVAPRGARVEEPIHLVFVSTGAAGRVASPRVLVVAEPGSHLRLIQDHVSLGEGAALTNAVAEVRVGEDARVDLVLVQRESDAALHFSNVAVDLERDARFGCHTLTLGGRLVRNDLSARLSGPGSEATLHGLFVGSGERLVDNHTLVDHAVPHGRSEELYKGILGGASRGVFRGRVLVRPDAQKTSALQSNPNLLLSDGAEIDTKPQLEIRADDVRCSHGSAIGQLEEEALFYLRSRGIGAHDARDLLTRGFAHEVLDSLPVEALREGLDEVLETSLAAATGRSLT